MANLVDKIRGKGHTSKVCTGRQVAGRESAKTIGSHSNLDSLWMHVRNYYFSSDMNTNKRFPSQCIIVKAPSFLFSSPTKNKKLDLDSKIGCGLTWRHNESIILDRTLCQPSCRRNFHSPCNSNFASLCYAAFHIGSLSNVSCLWGCRLDIIAQHEIVHDWSHRQ